MGGEREEQQRRNVSVHEKIEKLRELLRAGDGHAGSLKEEQESMEAERQSRMLLLNEEKAKLQRQKDLLIKKIKSQQKEKEEGMIYAREVSRVLARLNQITGGVIVPKK
jgi:tRNA U34 5-carboxymethylaminomethyl modifying GTPase MnmE/TrmE